MKRFVALAIPSLAAVTACASTPGARPQDMSAAQHETTAGMLERQAESHEAQYEPGARAAPGTCAHPSWGPCWGDVVNPTEEHLKRADELRKAAADHRAASRALREAEARACAGLSPEDRDISPFAHTEDIASVEPLYRSGNPVEGWHDTRLRGAVVTFRAVPGLTAPWLQRLVDCHLARNAALGHDAPEMSFCPLQPRDVTARVTESGAGIAVAIDSDKAETAREVLQRARSLVSR